MTAALQRALVIEDDRSWQGILAELLGDAGLVVDTAANLPAALALAARGIYRVAVVDLSLSPDDHLNQDGLRVLAELRQHNPGCAAVLLTGFATVELAVSALKEYGAFTCLQKERFQRSQFRELILQVLAEPVVVEGEELAGLSTREVEVLALLAQGLTNKEIAGRLVISDNTVKRHTKAIYRKLGVHTRSAAVRIYTEKMA